jgi:hypothetical protein
MKIPVEDGIALIESVVRIMHKQLAAMPDRIVCDAETHRRLEHRIAALHERLDEMTARKVRELRDLAGFTVQ